MSHQQWSSHENGQNSAHRLSFASRPTPPPCQQQEAAADTSLWCVLVSFPFITNDLLLHLNFFLSHQQWSSHVNGRNSAHRLSIASRPTPPPCQQQEAAAGPSLRCVLVFFQFFTNLFIAHLKFFLIHQQWSSHENGRNSAHRLSFASRPTPPPCQQQEAAADPSSWCVLVSFHFFTNDLLHI